MNQAELSTDELLILVLALARDNKQREERPALCLSLQRKLKAALSDMEDKELVTIA